MLAPATAETIAAALSARLGVNGADLTFAARSDSPGGEATGAMEAAAYVRQINAKKPVTAYVNGMATSAAYAVASGAGKIVTTPSSVLGSIGVVTMHLDRTAQIERQGLKPTIIVSGEHKADHSSLAPLSSGARGRIQAMSDEIYGLFAQTVATHRGMTIARVKDTKAGLFLGDAAVKLGLADRTGTLGDAIAVTKPAPFTLPQSSSTAAASSPVHTGATPMTAAAPVMSLAERRAVISASPFAVASPELADYLLSNPKISIADALSSLEVMAAPATKAPVSAADRFQAEFDGGRMAAEAILGRPQAKGAPRGFTDRSTQPSLILGLESAHGEGLRAGVRSKGWVGVVVSVGSARLGAGACIKKPAIREDAGRKSVALFNLVSQAIPLESGGIAAVVLSYAGYRNLLLRSRLALGVSVSRRLVCGLRLAVSLG